jgi:plastocyanin domain-containing protein
MKNKNNTLLLGATFIGVLWIGMMLLFYFESQKNSYLLQNDLGQNKNNENNRINQQAENNTLQSPSVQDVYLRAFSNGTYDKQEIVVKKGFPVRLHFTADRDAGCGKALVIYGLNVRTISKNGEEQTVVFKPEKEGVYQYSCAMGMWKPGKFVVTT